MIENMNTAQATERLRSVGIKISPQLLRLGIQQKVFPFGDCVVTEKGPRCYVYTKLLEDWIAKRTNGVQSAIKSDEEFLLALQNTYEKWKNNLQEDNKLC